MGAVTIIIIAVNAMSNLLFNYLSMQPITIKALIYLCVVMCISPLQAIETDDIELPPFHHIVHVKPSQLKDIDKALKLGDEGELVCKTCHGLKDIAKTPIDKVDTTAADFLNGGPYRPLTNFCYRCHDKETNSRENIHILLDQHGDIKKQACEYCHEEVPDRDKALKISELKLRLPIEILCYGCHLKDPHFNSVEHQLKPETDDMLKHLKKMRQQKNIFMPLTAKNEVTCVTCHTPHQRGVIDVNKPAGKQVDNTDLKEGVHYQDHPWAAVVNADKALRLDELNQTLNTEIQLNYQRLDKEVLLRLSAKNGELCLMCHTFKD